MSIRGAETTQCFRHKHSAWRTRSPSGGLPQGEWCLVWSQKPWTGCKHRSATSTIIYVGGTTLVTLLCQRTERKVREVVCLRGQVKHLFSRPVRPSVSRKVMSISIVVEQWHNLCQNQGNTAYVHNIYVKIYIHSRSRSGGWVTAPVSIDSFLIVNNLLIKWIDTSWYAV